MFENLEISKSSKIFENCKIVEILKSRDILEDIEISKFRDNNFEL
jgi:hypothetical protein